MKKLFKVFILFSLLSIGPFAISSSSLTNRPYGFDNPEMTVTEVLNKGKDNQVVSLKGRLTDFYGKDKYEFTDLEGNTIDVELDDDYPWDHIAKDQLIKITGEIDKDMFFISIDVFNATPLEPMKDSINAQ